MFVLLFCFASQGKEIQAGFCQSCPAGSTTVKDISKMGRSVANQWEVGVLSHAQCDKLFNRIQYHLSRYIHMSGGTDKEISRIVKQREKNRLKLETLEGLSRVYRNLCQEVYQADDTK